MKKSAVLVLVALLVGSNVAEALQTRGARSCGQWVQFRAQDDPTRLTPADTAKGWVIGLLSGIAIGTNKNFWGRPNIDSLDNESVYLWVDNYCRANPLKDISDAGMMLFLERCGKPGSCSD